MTTETNATSHVESLPDQSVPAVDKLTDGQKMRLDYFEKHALPWQFEHIRFRGLGLQIFLATQAGLLIAWSNSRAWPIGVFAILACISFSLWDDRNRQIIGHVHELGLKLADVFMFGIDKNGDYVEGVHKRFGETLKQSDAASSASGRLDFRSHTWAVRIMLYATAGLWIALLILQMVVALFPPIPPK